MPITIRMGQGALSEKTPENFPMIAMRKKNNENYQIKAEDQSISRRLSDRPTMTKNIGVNK